MSEPAYQADVNGLAEELRRTHGAAALDYALTTAKQYMAHSAWKNFAMWLQVVNRLNGANAPQAHAH
jgi:hypothetical protein